MQFESVKANISDIDKLEQLKLAKEFYKSLIETFEKCDGMIIVPFGASFIGIDTGLDEDGDESGLLSRVPERCGAEQLQEKLDTVLQQIEEYTAKVRDQSHE